METVPQRDFLMTEARIIQENSTHIAVALSLPKAWIARNLCFLAALADHAGAPEASLIAHD